MTVLEHGAFAFCGLLVYVLVTRIGEHRRQPSAAVAWVLVIAVLPFVTHAVSGLGRVVDDYREMLPDSTVRDGLAVRGEDVAQGRPAAQDWLDRAGLTTR